MESKQAYEKSNEARLRKHVRGIEKWVKLNLTMRCLFSDDEFNEGDVDYYRSFGLEVYERPHKFSNLWVVEWKTQDEIRAVLDQITERIGRGSVHLLCNV